MVRYTEGMADHPVQDTLSFEDGKALSAAAGKVLQPRTPITSRELFAGRWSQLTTVADAVAQPGLHVAIYGERGVGKTSLANVVKPTLWAFDNTGSPKNAQVERLVVKANANSGDGFSAIWDRLFAEIFWSDNRPAVGIAPQTRNRQTLRQAFSLPSPLSVDDVRRTLSRLPGSVFIIDEFDRAARDTATGFTDLVKSLSDFAVDCTVIVVGVSDTIDQLIADHASVSRALIQVLLPRMEAKELDEILGNAEKSLKISFSAESRRLIVHISQGLPHYTHLIGLHAIRKAALGRHTRLVHREDVFEALKEAVKQAQQSVTEKHANATHSAHKDALYRHVLLASGVAAATSHDALGYFNPGSLVEPLVTILGRPVQIATFNSHLAEFCQAKRGGVLERVGQARTYRYRFHDPLVVPFVFMDALTHELIDGEQLSALLGSQF